MRIRRAAASLFGTGVPPRAIVLTHIHPDHSGSAGRLARGWGVPVFVHPAELPLAAGGIVAGYANPVDRWVVGPMLRLLPPATRARLITAAALTDVVQPLDPEADVPGLPGWRCVATPGHTPGHVAFHRPADGLLLTGDAVLTVDVNSVGGVLRGRRTMAGPPRYTTWSWPAASASIATVARLRPRVLAPGHGEPVHDDVAPQLDALAGRLRRAPRRRTAGLLRPVDYSDRLSYRRPPGWYRRGQPIGFALAVLGWVPRHVVMLEVPGRRSGRPRRTLLVRATHDGQDYLVSLSGESQWVRNVRAAGGQVVLVHRWRRRAALVEIPADQRPPVIRAYVNRPPRVPGSWAAAREARSYFGTAADATDDELRAISERYPVFRILPAGSDEGRVAPVRAGHRRGE